MSGPLTYDAELEDAEEEAAPTSEKQLKRELRAEALRRLEDAARTAEDFAVVVEEWNKLDRNRERRERDHENLRGDVPLEYQARAGAEDRAALAEQSGGAAAVQRKLPGYSF